MTKKEQNKLNMYETVDSVAAENREITAKLAAFAPAETEFHGLLEAIHGRVRMAGESTAGKTAEKTDAKKSLVDSMLNVTAALKSYTRRNKNNELAAIIDVNETRLRKMRSAELEARAEMILQAARERLTALQDYDISEDNLTALKAAVSGYNAALGKRDSSVAQRQSAMISLHELFDEADDILRNDLDQLALLLRKWSPDFYNTYMNARLIRERGRRHTNTQNTPLPPTE